MTTTRYSYRCEALIYSNFVGSGSTVELELDQLDVKIVFLHGDPEEDIYIQTSVDGVQNCRKREYGMQIEEITIWIKAIPKIMVQAF